MRRFSTLLSTLANLELIYCFAFCALIALASILSFSQLELDSLASDDCTSTLDELKRKCSPKPRHGKTGTLVARSILLTQKTSGKAIGIPNYKKTLAEKCVAKMMTAEASNNDHPSDSNNSDSRR